MVCLCFSIIGSPFFFICVANLSFIISDLFRIGYSKVENFFCTICKKKDLGKAKNELNEIKDLIAEEIRKNRIRSIARIEDLDLLDLDRNKVTVPIVVAFLVLVIYIAAGSVLFTSLENWTYVQSMYFSFIAIATIGKMFFSKKK